MEVTKKKLKKDNVLMAICLQREGKDQQADIHNDMKHLLDNFLDIFHEPT